MLEAFSRAEITTLRVFTTIRPYNVYSQVLIYTVKLSKMIRALVTWTESPAFCH